MLRCQWLLPATICRFSGVQCLYMLRCSVVVIFICSDVQWFLSAGYKVIWVSFLSVHFMHWPLMPIKPLTTSFCCNQGNHSVVTSCMCMCVKDLSNQFCLSICQCCEKIWIWHIHSDCTKRLGRWDFHPSTFLRIKLSHAFWVVYIVTYSEPCHL